MAFENDDYTTDEPALAPSKPAGSPFAALRAEREAASKEVVIDLRVPRYATPVFVRYRAPEKARITAITDAAQKKRDKSVTPEAVLLAEYCVGVFEKDSDGNPIGDPADWPRFDERLAEYLGVDSETKSAADVVRKLFTTEGDIIKHATELISWAGFNAGDVDELYSEK